MNICVDTGFLIGLYSEKNPRVHSKAESLFVQHFNDNIQNKLLVPWPILYEAVATQMTKSQKRMEALNRDWKFLYRQGRLELLDDKPFREKAIDESFDEMLNDPLYYRGLSLTDRVIRNMLSDQNLKIDYFITFNKGDFIDICLRCHRKLLE
ncbi:MAG: hypothetical protein FIB07_13480 [Candidatus Methanoperedens sp.]|nr:hypothetical protein [Candidatus Methanoperedens sp.]